MSTNRTEYDAYPSRMYELDRESPYPLSLTPLYTHTIHKLEIRLQILVLPTIVHIKLIMCLYVKNV